MRSQYFISLIFTLSLASAQDGKEAPRGDHKKRDRGQTSRFFANLDADQDGKVTREEFNQARRIQDLEEDVRDQLFARLDKDSDGTITRKEIRPAKKDYAFHDPGRLLRQADQNKDGQISLEEFSKHPHFSKLEEKHRKRLFERLDRNEDGIIDPKDRPKGGGPGLRLSFEALDIDQNGSLSFEEFLKILHVQKMREESHRKYFERLDKDGDGKISPSELKFNSGSRHREGHSKKKSKKPAKN